MSVTSHYLMSLCVCVSENKSERWGGLSSQTVHPFWQHHHVWSIPGLGDPTIRPLPPLSGSSEVMTCSSKTLCTTLGTLRAPSHCSFWRGLPLFFSSGAMKNVLNCSPSVGNLQLSHCSYSRKCSHWDCEWCSVFVILVSAISMPPIGVFFKHSQQSVLF